MFSTTSLRSSLFQCPPTSSHEMLHAYFLFEESSIGPCTGRAGCPSSTERLWSSPNPPHRFTSVASAFFAIYRSTRDFFIALSFLSPTAAAALQRYSTSCSYSIFPSPGAGLSLCRATTKMKILLQCLRYHGKVPTREEQRAIDENMLLEFAGSSSVSYTPSSALRT